MANLTPRLDLLDQKRTLIALQRERARRVRTTKLHTYFPDEGPLRRELYPKHLEFFEAGARYNQRCMLAANRIGKTESIGGYETTLHLTGVYPDWWVGRRFKRGIKAWIVGRTTQSTRDILQTKLLGPINAIGTGLIPGDMIIDYKRKAGGVPDCIETVRIRHSSGGDSELGFKSYEQGRGAFEGTERELIWLDEEGDNADQVYGECLIRTMTTNGMVILTFTPLMGLSPIVMRFFPDGQPIKEDPVKYLVCATWDDVPHLDEKIKEEMLSECEPHLRDARSKGVPHMGSGVIYPVNLKDITVEPHEIPPHWQRCFAMDVGWNRTAALWGAVNRDDGCLYLYSEHYQGQVQPAIHAQAIRARGAWIPGVIDPAARGRSQIDGNALYDEYQELGLELSVADNQVEAGIYEVWTLLSSGRLKIFSNLKNLLAEMRLYRRDEKGKIIKDNDHLCDCMRYLVMTGRHLAKSEYQANYEDMRSDEHDMAKVRREFLNPIGGYG